MPKVSLVIPAYNAERYLRECLESVVCQTLRDIEVVCVDDGSTDGTLGIFREYAAADGRLKVISKPNGGYGQSMNRGIGASTGDYIGSVESDDFVSPEAYERMLAACEEHSLDFVKAGRASFVDGPGGRSFKPMRMARRPGQGESPFNPSENPSANLVGVGQPGLFRKSFLDSRGIRYNETPGASYQDTGFWAQCLFHARRALVLGDVLYYIRRDNPASSSLDTGKVYCICDEHDFVRARALEADGGMSGVCAKSSAAMRYDGYRWNLGRIAPKHRDGFVSRARADFLKLQDAGELDSGYWEEAKWRELQVLLESPMEYYARFCWEDPRLVQELERSAALRRELSEAKKALEQSRRRELQAKARMEAVRTSTSWRVGRAATALPRKVKRLMRKR